METAVATFSEKIASYPAEDRRRIDRGLRWVEAEDLDQILGVAAILVDLNLDTDAIIATALRKALEKGALSREEIAETFGGDTALLAEGIARIAGISAQNKTNHEAENIRKMLFAMIDDIRVILIKLADKLHGMRTLDLAEAGERKATAQECLDIYAPLADRLGISWMKDELEDLSFKQLNREAFVQIKNMVALKRAERRDFLGEIRKTIIVEAAAAGIVVTVESRAKHFYSIYQKMRKRSKAVEDIYDLLGIRILCETVDDCYNILGLTHRLWKPLEGRFKDYIAMHKANGYQSLHTTVMCVPDQDGEQPLEGRLLEIQIRTHEMHRTAEHGIASHWLYKRGGGAQAVKPGEIAIIDRLRDWKQAEEETKKQAGEQAREKAGDTARKKAGRKTRKQAGEEAGQEAEEGEDPPLTFLEEIKKELLRDSIYVFTPQGKVIELPAGATPIDFAYSIHSAVGNRCSGAKANGNIIPLNAALQNTQVVEILTATNARPHVNWLRFAKTSKARNRIRSWLQENDDSVIIEKNVIAKKKTPLPEPARDAPPPEKPPEAPIQHFVHEQIGTSGAFQVRVEDEKNMMIRFAKCCNPVSGDPIVGYVSRGRGIVIHRRNCRNLTNIPDFAERRIETEWETGGDLIKHFKIEARLSADLFSEIEGAARKQEGHLIEGRLEETSANHLTGFFTMQLQRPEDLKTIMKNIRGIPAVYSILSLN